MYFQLLAEVVMLPGDAFVRAIAKVAKKEFGKVRTISDISMTVIAAFLVGNIVRVYK